MNQEMAILAVVDIADSKHGRCMARCARDGTFSPHLLWLQPDLRLPERLAALPKVAAVAIPIGIKGATLHDRFTQRVLASIEGLTERNIPVFVAAGNYRANPLAQARGAVSAAADAGGASCSEACVRRAVKHVHAMVLAGNSADA